jgi:hypothetical protein
MLGPAGVAVGGASAAGEFRDEVRKARQQGAQIDTSKELLGAGVIIASNIAMGRFRPGQQVRLINGVPTTVTAAVADLAEQQAMKASVATALKKYALETGLAASDMMINGIAEDVVHQSTTNPDMQLGGASVERMGIGGLAHSVMGLKGTVRDVKAGMANADATVHEGNIPEGAGAGDSGSPVGSAEGVVAEKPAAQEAMPSTAEEYDSLVTKLQQEKVDADQRLQTDKTLTPEQRAELSKTSDHNAALVQNHLMDVETKFGEDASENLLSKVQTLKPTPPPKYPDRTPDASADETFKKLMSEPAKDIRPGQEAPQPEQMGVDKASKKAADIADKGVGRDVKRLLGEPEPGLPKVPRDGREWSYTKLKQWASDNGYDVARAENLRGLRKMISGQQHNSLTDLPELPGVAKTWNFRRLKYWAGQNGYDVEHAESRQEIKDIVDSARKADIQLTRKGPTAEAEEPAAVESVKKAVVAEPKVIEAEPAQSPVKKIIKAVGAPVADIYGSVIQPIGQKIRSHSQRLYGRVMDMYLGGGIEAERSMSKLVEPARRITDFLGGKEDSRYKKANVLALNGDRDALLNLFPEKMRPDVEAFYDMFRQKIVDQKAAGVNIGDLGDGYWNRILKDYKSFKAQYGEDTGIFDDAIAAEQAKTNKPLSEQEKMNVINRVVAGYGPRKPGQMGPSQARERTIEKLTPEQAEHYVPWIESAFTYADRSSRTVERYKFLGKNAENLDSSVGEIINREIKDGTLKPENQAEVKDLLNTLLTRDSVTMSPWARNLRQITHVATLGQVRSILNQTSDIVVTAFEHGFKDTFKGYMNEAGLRTGVKKIFQEETGIHGHGEEFKDIHQIGRLADKALKGFSVGDRFGKEGRINSAFERFSRAAKAPESSDFLTIQKKWEPVLGKEGFAEVMADLKAGRRTKGVYTWLALDVAEVQPITPAHMPEAYLKLKNGRLFWMLKSYMINQLDMMRRDVATDFKNQQGLKGVRKLAGLAVTLALFNFGKDLVVDLIRGKRVSPDQINDRSAEALLSVAGMNRFTGEKMLQEPTKTAEDQAAIPITWMDDLWKDFKTGGMKKVGATKKFNGLRSIKYVPLAGDIINYRTPLGHGYHQNQDEERTAQHRRIYGTH